MEAPTKVKCHLVLRLLVLTGSGQNNVEINRLGFYEKLENNWDDLNNTQLQSKKKYFPFSNIQAALNTKNVPSRLRF